DLLARYTTAVNSADRAYAQKLVDEAKSTADTDPDNRLTLTRYQQAEDEIKTMLDTAFHEKNAELKSFYESLYKRLVTESDQLVTRQFTTEAQAKITPIDCLSGAKANQWN